MLRRTHSVHLVAIALFLLTSFSITPNQGGILPVEASVLTGGGSSALATTEPPLPIPLDANKLTDTQRTLLSQARQNGLVDVIVGLKVAYQFPEQARPQQLAAQQVMVQQVRLTLLQSLSGYAVRVLSDSANWVFPFVALNVDENALSILFGSPNVQSIEPNLELYPILDSAEPVIHAPQVWAMGYTGSGQTVAIVDSGVDRTHPFPEQPRRRGSLLFGRQRRGV